MRFLHTFTVNPDSEDEPMASAAASSGGKMAALVVGGQDGRDDPAAIGWPRSGDISPAFFARNGPTENMRSLLFFHYSRSN
jgi:hypothetical protein